MAKNKQECPSCAMMIDADVVACPICGYEFPKASKGIKWVAILLLVVIGIYFLLHVIGK